MSFQPDVFSFLTADVAVTASVVVVEATDLAIIGLGSGTGKYIFAGFIPFDLADTSMGYKFQMGFGLTSLIRTSGIIYNMSGNTIAGSWRHVNATNTQVAGALAATGTHVLKFDGYVEFASGGSSLGFNFAQNSSTGAAITLLKGGWLQARRVG